VADGSIEKEEEEKEKEVSNVKKQNWGGYSSRL
jgi:hypothetical protein